MTTKAKRCDRRDLAADLAYANECQRTEAGLTAWNRESYNIATHAIQRAIEAEAEVERIRNYVEKRLARAEKRVNEIAADHGEKPEQTHTYFGGRSLGYWQGRASALDDVLSNLPEVPDDAA